MVHGESARHLSSLLSTFHIAINYTKKNSLFEFDTFGIVKVYSSQEKYFHCNKQQSYWIDSTGLNFFEYDFFFNYEIENLSKDSLSVFIKTLPDYVYEEKMDIEKFILDNNLDVKGIKVELVKVR